MIKITSLNKIYKSKKRKTCHALNDINLSLPDTGLVFVLGKSGSGKSTLLNLIGGLDSITSGQIEVDGNDLSKFREGDFCNYRNTHIGFIFQDYHLIDELTVYENIVLSLNLRRIEDKDKVKAALAKVDLAGYEDRYPTELSGGEQQRVAIARAIVKNPRIILADEPTGNLDTHTAKSIVELLKNLSKECLILIVSHNVNDANAYADRIIELAKGKIISDKSRNPEFADEVTLDGDNLIYPKGLALSDSDIDFINNNLNKKFVKRTDKFISTPENEKAAKKIKIENKSLSLGKELNLSGKFLKNKALAISLSSFMVAVIMVIMALAQTIVAFDGGHIIADEMAKSNQSSLLLNKVVDAETQARLDEHYRAEIGENDIQSFYDAGYKGKIYPVINVTVPITDVKNSFGISSPYFGKDIYIKSALGTMVVEEDFIEKKFGNLDYIVKLDDPSPYGLIITDYIADCILATNPNYKGKDYGSIIGKYNASTWQQSYLTINAIINTGYKEKHANILERMENPASFNINDLYSDKDFIALSNDIYDSLGYSYSLTPDFYEYAHLPRNVHTSHKIVINDSINSVEIPDSFISVITPEAYAPIKNNRLGMSMQKYNELFNTSYDSTNLHLFVPHEMELTVYRHYDINNENPLYTMNVTVDALYPANNTFIFTDGVYPELEELVGKNGTYYYGLYFDGTEGIGAVLDLSEELNYEHQSYAVEGIHTMTRAVDVFVPIFEFISIFLYIGVIFILMNFSSKMINDKMHEIGILKALGTKNSSVGVVFGLQIMLIALLTCGLATLGYFLFIDVANDILIESIRRIAPNWTLPELQFLTFKADIALINCCLTFGLAILSLIAPMIKIKSIKPVKIIKAKE